LLKSSRLTIPNLILIVLLTTPASLHRLFDCVVPKRTMDDTTDLEDIADVYILKFVLDGLKENESDSEISRLNWFGRIRRYLRGWIATNPRTTHWAAEIRGDLYETFRHREYYLPWRWRATLKYTAKDAQGKEPHRKPMKRFHVGTTALSTEQIAERSNIIANFE
jgi:hypothetical protein